MQLKGLREGAPCKRDALFFPRLTFPEHGWRLKNCALAASQLTTAEDAIHAPIRDAKKESLNYPHSMSSRTTYPDDFLSDLTYHYARGLTLLTIFPKLNVAYPELNLTQDKLRYVIQKRQAELTGAREAYQTQSKLNAHERMKETQNRFADVEHSLLDTLESELSKNRKALECMQPWEKGYSTILGNVDKLSARIEKLSLTGLGRDLIKEEGKLRLKRQFDDKNSDDLDSLPTTGDVVIVD